MSDGGSDNGGKTLRANSRGSRTFGSEDTWLRFWARVWQRGERLPGREGLFRVHYEGYVPRPIGTQ